MKRFLAVGVGLLLGAALLPVTAEAQAPERGGWTPAPVAWGVCADPRLQQIGAECGFVRVPLDYARPDGAKIELAVSRVKHSSSEKDYQGVMLTNPGGPGGSGLIVPVLGRFVPGGVGADYDWIGFDPRGVGSSRPALSCDVNYTGYNRPDYVPTTRQIEQAWLSKAKAYAEACDKAGGPLLDHMKTTDTIADMESIRRALGAKKINFYGLSYGTYLGQVYATLHPQKVGRMVFDANVDPTRVWYGGNLDQNVEFDKASRVFFDWVAEHDEIYHLGTTGKAVRNRFYAERRQLNATPAAGQIGPSEWDDIFLSAGYNVNYWPDMATVFSAWANGKDATGLLDLYAPPGTPGADNGYAVYLATVCTDVTWPRDWATWKRDAWALHARYPFLTWGNTWFNAPCRDWGARPGTPVRVDGAKTPPILLINETGDAATPFSGALEVRKRFPRSVLVEGVGGTTHAGSLSGVACVDDTIADYLRDGTLPKRVGGNRSDRQCAPVPVPDPSAARVADADGISRADVQQLIGR
ncbi:alpha/beta hydrolase [Actinoplanes sp. TRM 88003]|uniref:Alpha/beta hydrolase n=1 Tax=Paractinoplanes aksuensis TaxID=2939490 RepID=A0ABT1DX75_9ACTN|nr:alpha/beta hydrolase [Actinoplanes aksuensis]MCO8275480.1 alpha/beta hydrolase [Actinoplanes aksuensis]